MKKLFLLLLTALLLQGYGCGGGSFELAESAAYDLDAAAPMASRSVSAGGEPIDVQENPETGLKKIIRNGRMGLQVADLDASKRQTDSLANRFGAYYSRENYTDDYRGPAIVLTIRIPEARYTPFVAAAESGGGKILYKEISARDVTEEYLDVETRLANKRSYLERYRELVKRASTIKEVMEVEEQVRKLEEEIESAEGRLRYLDNQAGYSTLELTLTTEYKYTPEPKNRFWERLKEALSGGWQGIVSLVLGLLYIWPLWIIAGVVLFVLIRRKRKSGQKK